MLSRNTTNYQCFANYFGHFIMSDLFKCHGSIARSVFLNSHFQSFICPRKIMSHSYSCTLFTFHCMLFFKKLSPTNMFSTGSTKRRLSKSNIYFGQEHISAHSVYAYLENTHVIQVPVPLLLCQFNNISFRYSCRTIKA